MKHPAIVAYEDLYERILNEGKTDAGWMPMGSGDPVGRARLEAEWTRRGIEYPENIVEMFHWWEKIGGLVVAKRITRKEKKRRKMLRGEDSNL